MYDQLSQALSTHHAPFETGSRKRSGLFVILYNNTVDLRLVLEALDSYRCSMAERQLQHPRMLLPRRVG
ncbi:hypothetical protein BDW59DRAFT_106236 [Aspergillus cavernicola]|uniref:Uncharacterized protein n=1 Tax=Aspergillus cavernicola TaxID=176166 RepID=A0ABR4IXR0_9EURO